MLEQRWKVTEHNNAAYVIQFNVFCKASLIIIYHDFPDDNILFQCLSEKSRRDNNL